MELVELKCDNCGKEIYIYENHVREQMYCTLKCLEYVENRASINQNDFQQIELYQIT